MRPPMMGNRPMGSFVSPHALLIWSAAVDLLELHLDAPGLRNYSEHKAASELRADYSASVVSTLCRQSVATTGPILQAANGKLWWATANGAASNGVRKLPICPTHSGVWLHAPPMVVIAWPSEGLV